mmetsp:Transcript_37118/g.93166  ORF Transcript_37118/g.93166 Transcript_37118/m.93166 type:complete len:341 (-) Transcript_37118:122-1144(-)
MSGRVECGELGQLNVARQIVHRLVVHAAEAAVDLGDETADLGGHGAVVLQRGQIVIVALRRKAQLHQHHTPHPLGMVGEETAEGLQLERDALHHLQRVLAQDDAHAAELFTQCRHPALHRIAERIEAFRVHTDRYDANGHAAVATAHAARRGLHLEVCRQQTLAAGEKVARIVERLEADHIALQHRLQDLRAHRQTAEDLGGGEGAMQEEANTRAGRALLLAQVGTDQQQVVVVHPDQIAGTVEARHRLGEEAIHHLVAGPRIGVKVIGGEVVHHRPEYLFTGALIVGTSHRTGNPHWFYALSAEPVGQLDLLLCTQMSGTVFRTGRHRSRQGVFVGLRC